MARDRVHLEAAGRAGYAIRNYEEALRVADAFMYALRTGAAV
jgi:hypothetical protein